MSNTFGFIGPIHPGQQGPGMGGPPPGYMSGPHIGPGVHGINPATNNQPLQFNTNKGKPPMAIPIHRSPDGNDSPGDDMVLVNDNGDSSSPGMGPGGMSNMGGPPMGGPWGMMGPMGPMADPNMNPNMMLGPMGFGQFGFMGPGMSMDNSMPPKEVITLKSCVLYPPPPNAPPPSTREKPPGCRTIFVGGLPENISEEITREIFDEFGTITSVRMSKKNFAHIRYDMLDAVDKALFLSGYRIKLDNQDDKPNTGRIHVDYAQARDDLYEWECAQRAYARESRHRMRIEEERLRPPSPPPIIHYSDHESSVLLEKLKNDDSFMVGTQVLMTWLERGDCTRRTANNFYSLIQSTNSHVRRLLSEKAQYDEEYEAMKQKFRQRLEGILRQFEQIEKVFSASTKQKAWDHFSKAQRKNLESWRKQCQELHEAQEREFFQDRQEAEMEMSDSDGEGDVQQATSTTGPPAKKKKNGAEFTVSEWIQMNTVREDNDSLKCQLEAYKNEVDLLKQENSNATDEKDKQIKALQMALQGMQQQLISSKKQNKSSPSEITMVDLVSSDEKDQQIRGLQQAMQGMQQQLIASKQQVKRSEEEVRELKAGNIGSASDTDVQIIQVPGQGSESPREEGASPKPQEVKEGSPGVTAIGVTASGVTASGVTASGVTTSGVTASGVTTGGPPLSDRDARLIAVMSTFLHVHPFGASIDYIWSYLQRLNILIRTSELEDVLEKFPKLFRLTLMGVGASLEKRWKFVGFDTAQVHIL